MRLKFVSLTSLLLLSASTWIHAAPAVDVGELGISNQTRQSLSFTVNKICSNDIGDVLGYSIKTVKVTKIIKACAESKTCEILAYDRPNCKGYLIGGVKIDFLNRNMEVISPINPDDINVGGSIGLYEYNIFFSESFKSNNVAKK
jgi:hypothetical protein